MVGVLVPPSVGGCLTNVALQIMGKASINLNYTASAHALESSAQRCHLTHCITAKAFLARVPLKVPGTPVYLEDIMATVTSKDRIVGLLLAAFCPTRLLERLVGAPKRRSCHDLATVIFSSGSEGVPKGVMLSHYNLIHNIATVGQIFPHKRGDVMTGMLPFFHSFGFLGCLWLPFHLGMSTVFHPSPLEAKAIGDLVRKYKATFLIGTSTFLQNFIRKCAPEDLRSLKYVVCGAEKLSARVRDAFLEKFGVEPLEGYGTTECSPIVSVNIPDFQAPGFVQKGTKRGTIGRPVPGMSARIVDADTGALLGENQPGLLQVKGQNVMQGYLGMPEKTAAVLKDGWYSTGDIASIDEEGFITITDRLARFSKIAGEMISHTRVEESLHELLGLTEQSLAVAGVRDETRGERLVVLNILTDDQLTKLLAGMDRSGLPNLWRPRANAFYRVDAIPVLGTGKMDLKGIKTLADTLAVARDA
jgi:acyl-[acyl-carrier-protein]-phospholipid O-acyltransferase / long-chain-fatty-acid--[acyl-carrier-protein] ligase